MAEKALRIFKRLRVPDITGTPTNDEVCEQWVFDLVRVIFGSYDPEARRRMIRNFFLMIPKKNGKSSISAAIIVVAAILNDRPMAELILIAETQNIAKIAFRQAQGIIELDDGIKALFRVNTNLKEITHLNTGAVIKILSADGDVVTGSKAAYVLIDETHVLGHKAKAAEVFLEIEGGLSSRPEGFVLEITTQSKVPPHGEFKKRLDRARDVRDGRLDLPMLPIIYEFPEAMQKDRRWEDEVNWALVNPNLERSTSLDVLRSKFIEAKDSGPESLALFASQFLNVQIGLGLMSNAWAGAPYWEAAAEPGLDFDAIIRRCDVVVAGIDGGGLDDLVALSLIGREKGSRRWLHWVRAWAQPDVLERRKSIVPRLRDFEADGDLVICTSTDQDAAEIAEICKRVNEAGLFPETAGIGLDAFGVATILDALDEAELGALTAAVPQGYKLQSAINTVPRKIKDRTMRHCGQAIMAWSVGNAKAELKGSNIVVTKQAAGAAKIDPFMATMNAAILMLANPVASAAAAYTYDGM
ncbi:terminase large subunit [Pararhodobacter zhoushanensis]|uniref:terminase large subunit n=1 Tax=Pararhodobacter zhoushanensis TaxID=2479545 RepID=UPI001FE32263|nr:terminase large subunit [Pararhodobacter zhoushanensis]